MTYGLLRDGRYGHVVLHTIFYAMSGTDIRHGTTRKRASTRAALGSSRRYASIRDVSTRSQNATSVPLFAYAKRDVSTGLRVCQTLCQYWVSRMQCIVRALCLSFLSRSFSLPPCLPPSRLAPVSVQGPRARVSRQVSGLRSRVQGLGPGV
eukprot:2919391-Rhodomonas_salina.1